MRTHHLADGMGLTDLPGGVCVTPEVTAAGIAAGLKASGKPDLALVDAGRTVAAAAVQTTNQVQAAPVTLTARHAANGRARAVLLNSGSANVCTGPDGMALAEESAAAVGSALGCDPTDVLACSTGVIGVPLPRAPLLAGIPTLAAARSREGGHRAATAIMTTDTFSKETAVRVEDSAGGCVIGGMAKGAGMLEPAMATMLAVVTTDAPVQGPVLRSCLRDVVAQTFGRISVDGCQSTNDAVIVLATGTATRPPSLAAFKDGLVAVCGRLAESLVRDGEGATKLVRLRVTGARREEDAVAIGRAIAGSVLVRTAIAGGDPNWGRILAAAGACPVPFEPARVAVTFGRVTVCRFGVVTAFDHGQAVAALAGREVLVTVDLGLGGAEATFLTCDLTHDYVTINAEYTT